MLLTKKPFGCIIYDGGADMHNFHKLALVCATMIFLAGCGKKLAPKVPIMPGATREQKIEVLAREIELRAELEKLEKSKKKFENKFERQAREIVEKDENRSIKATRRVAMALLNAEITGCAGGEVRVEPRATGNDSQQAHVKVRVTNIHSRPINIEDERGQIVFNLCPGGALTLFRSREMFTDPNYIQFHFVAKGRFPDGSLGMQESQWFTLSAYDVSSGRAGQYYSWSVQLQKVYQAQ